jgi:PTH1 family peptidyl-tRNA hydrolase
MKLIVGLGNPGKEYDGTRHNIGFMVIDSILKKYNLNCNKKKFDGIYCETTINNEKIIFLKPQRFINLSGEVIKKYIDYFKISIEDILVIHDDLDIPVGKFKLKMSGGSAGHNGLKNIEMNIGTEEYKRLKIGISNDKAIDTKVYVLGKLSSIDKKELDEIIDMSEEIVSDYINMSFVDLMSKYNRK